MKKSIIPGAYPDRCFLCGRNGSADHLEMHHIFGGPNRKHSDQDGLFVLLCGSRCHRDGPESAHKSAKTAQCLHEIGQMAWEAKYGSREEFVKRYGKNYLKIKEE